MGGQRYVFNFKSRLSASGLAASWRTISQGLNNCAGRFIIATAGLVRTVSLKRLNVQTFLRFLIVLTQVTRAIKTLKLYSSYRFRQKSA